MFVVFEFSIQGMLGSLELESCDFENIFVTTLVNRDHVWPKIGFCNMSHHLMVLEVITGYPAKIA